VDVPVDSESLFVLVLGPATIGLLIAALIWWLQRRRAPKE
jgi:hypothetical protein